MVKLGLVKRECVATSIHITVRCTAENKSIDPNSGKKTFGDELQQKLEEDEIH